MRGCPERRATHRAALEFRIDCQPAQLRRMFQADSHPWVIAPRSVIGRPAKAEKLGHRPTPQALGRGEFRRDLEIPLPSQRVAQPVRGRLAEDESTSPRFSQPLGFRALGQELGLILAQQIEAESLCAFALYAAV